MQTHDSVHQHQTGRRYRARSHVQFRDAGCLQRTIPDLPYIYINGGHRGYLVGMAPADLIRVLKSILVDAATTA